MTKFAAFVAAAALALSLSIGTGTATEDGPRLVLTGANAGLRLPDGRAVQFEYLPFVLTHYHDERLAIWEDGTPGLVDCERGIVRDPRGTSYPFACDRTAQN